MGGGKGRDFVIGVDFGTDSVRALVVDAADGEVLGEGVSAYSRWARGMYCDPKADRFRQHPLDYVESLEACVAAALADSGGGAARKVRGITVDTTGSTPCLADGSGSPLALRPEFADDPDAMFMLWKDHTAVREAELINGLARTWGGEDYTRYEGGVYSSEWFWAKALHLVLSGAKPASVAATVIEHCDWMPALLTGVARASELKRSRCAMGHKAMWHASWGGYPGADFFDRLHPRLSELASSLGSETFVAEDAAGTLCPEWAGRLGLPAGVVVGVGAFDCHIGSLGGDVAPGTLVKIMGTSTCDIMIGPKPAPGRPEALVAGICGQVDGSVIRGMIGYEAGQSAFGDCFAWLRRILAWPARAGLLGGGVDAAAFEDLILPALEAEAAGIDPARSGVVALDWLNGRRTPDADQALTGAIAGLDLGADAPSLYRALIEAAAFGSRAIVERMREQGLPVERVVAVGGVARKSPLVMQIVADVLGMDIAVSSSDQSCALGGAMFASCAAGLHPDALAAQASMRAPLERTYAPDAKRRAAYDALYGKYRALGEFAGKEMRK